ncbi:MAG: hypothetical protein AAFR17_07260 [Pseudomonadota bacterium]
MPYSGTGNFGVSSGPGGTVNLTAGLDADGALVFTGGTYAIDATLIAGANFAQSTMVTGEIRLFSGTEIVFAPSAGDPAAIYVGRNANTPVAAGEIRAIGRLDVLGGSRIESRYTAPASGSGANAYNSFQVGATAGAQGQITVDGQGSELIAGGDGARINLGTAGQGALVVSDGGYARTLDLRAGSDGGLGQVYVSGAGSELRLTSAGGAPIDAAYAGQTGYATFGRAGGAGFLGVAGGGTLQIENVAGETDRPLLRFGSTNGSYGYGLVNGAGSLIRIRQLGAQGDDFAGGATLNVGEGGQGVLLVEDEASVIVSGDRARLNVATGRLVQGQPDTTSDESLLQITGGGDVLVDSGGNGGTVLQNGLRVSNDRGAAVTIAAGEGSRGRVVVDGVGSTLTVTSTSDALEDEATGQIVVGNLGTATLRVANSGSVAAKDLELGRSVTDGAAVIAAGSGRVEIASGGQVVVVGSDNTLGRGISAGATLGATGTITVDGAGSELVSTGGAGRLDIGREGTGSLALSGGGTAKALIAEAGRGAGGTGTISVSGTGSQLIVSDAYGVSPANAGQAGLIRLGGASGGSGSLDVAAGGSVLVENAANSTSDQPSIIVGTETGSSGSFSVTGAGSTVDIVLTGASNDAYMPSETLFYGPRLRLGQRGGEGNVTVSQSAALNLTGENAEIWVGEGDPAYQAALSTFKINGRGQVAVTSVGGDSAASVIIGRNEGGRGALTLFGTDSRLTISSDNQGAAGSSVGASLVVGRLGDGDLTVSNGAAVVIDGANDAFPGLVIGRGAESGAVAATGTARISGGSVTITGTTQTNFGEAGLITVGQRTAASGELVIDSAGQVTNATQNSATIVAVEDGSTGTIRLRDQGSRLEAGVLLTVGAEVDFSTVSQGLPLVLEELGGQGVLDIGAGTMVNAGTAVIGSTGTLAGSGTLAADLDLFGRLSPGGDGEVGIFTHQGDLDLNPGAVLSLDIDGFSNGSADRIVTTADLDMDFSQFSYDITLAPGIGQSPGQVVVLETSGQITEFNIDITSVGGALFQLRGVEGVGVLLSLQGLVLTGTSGADTITGGTGDDTLVGSPGADRMEGRGGRDTLDYAGSAAGVTVNLNTATASGGDAEGDEVLAIENLIGSNFEDRLTGDDKINRIDGGLRADTISGVGGGDQLFGGGGNDSLLGGPGNDTLDGGVSGDTLDGGSGADQLFGGDGVDSLSGSLNADSLFGGAGADRLSGGAAGDFLDGGSENDNLDGGAGPDTLIGGAGLDSLFGRGGHDRLEGGTEADRLFGGAGNDRLIGGAGADSLTGGTGRDRADYADASAAVTVDLSGVEAQTGDAEGDTFNGIEDLGGSAFNDRLTGDAGANQLFGEGGNDLLLGGAGADTLFGGGGIDQLRGNAGTDTLFGGDGTDRFFFLAEDDSPAGSSRDVIGDFAANELLSFSSIDADSTSPGNDVFIFLGTDAFSGMPGELRFAKSAANGFTLIHGDTDGDRLADLQVEITGIFDLTADNFIL